MGTLEEADAGDEWAALTRRHEILTGNEPEHQKC